MGATAGRFAVAVKLGSDGIGARTLRISRQTRRAHGALLQGSERWGCDRVMWIRAHGNRAKGRSYKAWEIVCIRAEGIAHSETVSLDQTPNGQVSGMPAACWSARAVTALVWSNQV